MSGAGPTGGRAGPGTCPSNPRFLRPALNLPDGEKTNDGAEASRSFFRGAGPPPGSPSPRRHPHRRAPIHTPPVASPTASRFARSFSRGEVTASRPVSAYSSAPSFPFLSFLLHPRYATGNFQNPPPFLPSLSLSDAPDLRRRHGGRAAGGGHRRTASRRGRGHGHAGAAAGEPALRAHPVPHQDVPDGGRPRRGRRHLLDPRRRRLRGVAPRRVRAGPPAQVLQAQQLLQLRAPAQHLRVPEDRAGPVGVRQRLLPARGEAPAVRHPAPEGCGAGRGRRHGGRGRGDPRGAAGRGRRLLLPHVLRRRAGAVVQLVPGAAALPAAAAAAGVRVLVRRRGRGERPPAPRQRAPGARARADAQALQQHPPPHDQVRRHAAARRRRAQGRELLRRRGVRRGRRDAAAAAAPAAVRARAPALVPRR